MNDVEEYVWKMDNPYRKTVVDTSVIPIKTIEKWAKSAFINVEIKSKKTIMQMFIKISDGLILYYLPLKLYIIYYNSYEIFANLKYKD